MAMPYSPDRDLAEIGAKVAESCRLSAADGLALYASRNIHEIGRLSDSIRERLHGAAAYYNVNRHINYTNYCVLRCKFCSFYRPYATGHGVLASRSLDKNGDAVGAYELSVDQVVDCARKAYETGATEAHIVGGLHPALPFSYYLDMCRSIRQACPRLFIKAFTAVEIIHFTRIARPRMSVRQVLEELRAAGLDSLPGGGAEIFDDRVHGEAYRNKVGEEGWFEVHRVAHEMGLPTNATMLYGHVERLEERINHMIKLREHQDESLRSRPGAFNCFVPLSFIPEGSGLSHLPGPSGLDDLKTLAISRLMLDNFRHIKAFWIMHSAKLAQVSLNWGVDDLDGTVAFYDITKREGGPGNQRQRMTVEQIHRLIHEAGRQPVERDTLYRRVIREGTEWRCGEPV